MAADAMSWRALARRLNFRCRSALKTARHVRRGIMDGIRKCLLEALKAIASARPRIDFKIAFEFMMRYVPRCAKDKELARAFEAANDAMTDDKQKKRGSSG
jgi:hypothetical protein